MMMLTTIDGKMQYYQDTQQSKVVFYIFPTCSFHFQFKI